MLRRRSLEERVHNPWTTSGSRLVKRRPPRRIRAEHGVCLVFQQECHHPHMTQAGSQQQRCDALPVPAIDLGPQFQQVQQRVLPGTVALPGAVCAARLHAAKPDLHLKMSSFCVVEASNAGGQSHCLDIHFGHSSLWTGRLYTSEYIAGAGTRPLQEILQLVHQIATLLHVFCEGCGRRFDLDHRPTSLPLRPHHWHAIWAQAVLGVNRHARPTAASRSKGPTQLLPCWLPQLLHEDRHREMGSLLMLQVHVELTPLAVFDAEAPTFISQVDATAAQNLDDLVPPPAGKGEVDLGPRLVRGVRTATRLLDAMGAPATAHEASRGIAAARNG
mmetsp:Transcript_22840/g.53841  ORF Transcript_22840/g.53841 Transcript_22840/m.53841 type:complete len:331 (+) Transcript_22840:464-1456(+)